jgi:hypothetical protein
MEIIIAAAVSLFVQWLKSSAKLGEYQTLGLVILVSFFVAAVYTYLVNTGLWDAFAGILVMAGAIYTFIISRFTSGSALGKYMGTG